MQIKILGEDLEVSAVGLDCMELSHAYGLTGKDEAVRLARKAFENGYIFF